MILRYSQIFTGVTFDGSSPIDFSHDLGGGNNRWRVRQIYICTTIRTAYGTPARLSIDCGLRAVGRHFSNAGTGIADDGYMHFNIPASTAVNIFAAPPKEADFEGSFDLRFVLTDDAATIGQNIEISVIAEVDAIS